MSEYQGGYVRVARMLVDKPLFTFERGWMLRDALRDISKTEPCGAVGKCGHTFEDGATLVYFLHPSTRATTCAFAMLEDISLASVDELSWPPGADMFGHWRGYNQYWELTDDNMHALREALQAGDSVQALAILDTSIMPLAAKVGDNVITRD